MLLINQAHLSLWRCYLFNIVGVELDYLW